MFVPTKVYRRAAANTMKSSQSYTLDILCPLIGLAP